MELTLDERVLLAIEIVPVDRMDREVRVAIVEKGRKRGTMRRGNRYRWILLKGECHFLKLSDANTSYVMPDGETVVRWKRAPARMNRILYAKCFPFLMPE